MDTDNLEGGYARVYHWPLHPTLIGATTLPRRLRVVAPLRSRLMTRRTWVVPAVAIVVAVAVGAMQRPPAPTRTYSAPSPPETVMGPTLPASQVVPVWGDLPAPVMRATIGP